MRAYIYRTVRKGSDSPTASNNRFSPCGTSESRVTRTRNIKIATMKMIVNKMTVILLSLLTCVKFAAFAFDACCVPP